MSHSLRRILVWSYTIWKYGKILPLFFFISPFIPRFYIPSWIFIWYMEYKKVVITFILRIHVFASSLVYIFQLHW